jgi:hypothetical protein
MRVFGDRPHSGYVLVRSVVPRPGQRQDCLPQLPADDRILQKEALGMDTKSHSVLRATRRVGAMNAPQRSINAAGKAVFRTTGFGVVLDEDETGEDFGGDGKPEVVFVTDEAGGAHGCWVRNVIPLWPRPHKLFDRGGGGHRKGQRRNSDHLAARGGNDGVHHRRLTDRTPSRRIACAAESSWM